ncbi:PRTRC system protein F [Janthinobacterium sp. SUN033]|uniref:PRTRC system protein F n=1 Tax=Janthinobacterium sp. SUN033 TaxID=3002439 RepID=UPI0025B267E3|nr:PRTRC system protein F [Janthinobacterium sp. SUN033]MDN2675665.1 PRTRC system protein F [Janthinobacterium sp. SUN033]
MMGPGLLAMPTLHAGIPSAVRLREPNSLVAPLAIALLQANQITAAMLKPRPNALLVEVFAEPDERALAAKALSTWWTSIQYYSKYFSWGLHVQQLPEDGYHHQHDSGTIWFCMTRNTDVPMPRFALEPRITEMEQHLAGFGQTVLAVLFDATMYLPNALDPWRAVSAAEWLHWHECQTDEELLEDQREERGYDTIQQVIDDGDILTRAEFYGDMPRWVTHPARVLSRGEIVAAASNSFHRDVIAACDAIAALVNGPEFTIRPHEVGAHNYPADCVDGCMVLLWSDNDQISRVLDDELNMHGESGEYIEFIDVHGMVPSGAAIKKYQSRTRQVMQLAQLTERLLELIGEII